MEKLTTIYTEIAGGYNLYALSKTGWRKCNYKPISDFEKIKKDNPLTIAEYFAECQSKKEYKSILKLANFLEENEG